MKSRITVVSALFLGLSLPFNIAIAAEESGTSAAGATAVTTAESAEVTTSTGAASPAFEPVINYKSDLARNMDGGVERHSAVIGNLNLSARLELEKLMGWRGAKAYAQALAVHGTSLNQWVGDTQVSSNIEASRALRMYQAWIDQSFAKDRVSVLAGLHDLNSEFYATESSAVLLNSTFGVGPELSHSGVAGPSIFPITSLALRARVNPVEQAQIQGAVYDADPTDDRAFAQEAGVLGVAEVAYLSKINGIPGKYALGAWSYSSRFDHLTDTNEEGTPLRAASRGAYALVDQKIYAPSAESEEGLSSFVRVGVSSPETNAVSGSLGAGVGYTGLIPTRSADRVAVGLAVARSSAQYRAAQAAEGVDATTSERALEITYRARLVEWLHLQPDFQWIVNPGFDPNLPSAKVVSARLEVEL